MPLSAGISALFVFGRKPCIDRLIRIGADLELGAMMVGVVAVFISAMGRHELDHLQGQTSDLAGKIQDGKPFPGFGCEACQLVCFDATRITPMPF